MNVAAKILVASLSSLATLSVIIGCGTASAAERHVTLRLEDGMPRGTGFGLPITIVVPVDKGKGGNGAGLASFVEYGPYRIDGSRLSFANGRITGKVSGISRSGFSTPEWTIDATVVKDQITGRAHATAEGRSPPVESRVTGYIDPAEGGAWMIECGMPWTDGGSHAKLAADASDFTQCFIVRLRINDRGGAIVGVGSPNTDARRVQSAKIDGSPESFTADVSCLASDGKTPIRVNLRGGRIGRGGIVEGTIAVADKSWGGRVKLWKGAATVWAWPDADGFTGGPEKDLAGWSHDANPDPGLVEAAQAEAALPIHPATSGGSDIWTHNVLQRSHRSTLRCIAPPQFDIRPLPVADTYRLIVKRITGVPIIRVDKQCTDPYAELAAAWPKASARNPKDKSHLGLHRYELTIDGKSVWALDAWWGGKASKEPPAWLAPVMQARQYRVVVTRDKEDQATVATRVESPHDPLTAVWSQLTPGTYHIEVQGIDEDGTPRGARPWRATFAKVHAFNGPYFSQPARS